jgi:hypothetical protein
MTTTRTVSVLTGGVTDKQVSQAVRELNARLEALRTWDKVAYGLGERFERSYLWQVAMGKRRPSRRLLRALNIIKPEKRSGIRVRITDTEASDLLRGEVGVRLQAKVRYQLGAK